MGGTSTRFGKYNNPTLSTVTGVAFYLTASSDWPSDEVRVFIYQASALDGMPGTLVASSGYLLNTLVQGWNIIPIPAVALGPGDYWLGASISIGDVLYSWWYVAGTGAYTPNSWTSSPPPPDLTGYNIYYTDNFTFRAICQEATLTPTMSLTATHSASPTVTDTLTITMTPTVTLTPTDTETPTDTPTSTDTPTATATVFHPYLGQWGGPGTLCGQFQSPEDVAVYSSTYVFVADTGNNRIQEFFAGTYYCRRMVGRNGGDGTSGTGDGEFDQPSGVAVDGNGNVYVADTNNNRVQEFLWSWSSLDFNRTWGTYGTGNQQFDHPLGIWISAGYPYVADTGNDRILVFDWNGAYVSKFGVTGSNDGQFIDPNAVVQGSGGRIFVLDPGNQRIQRFYNTTVDASWAVPAGAQDIAADPTGNIYLADTANDRIQVFSESGSFLGQWGGTGTGDGQFDHPKGVAVADDGNVYVADTGNNRIQVFGP